MHGNYKRLPSHMTHAFSRVPTISHPRSKFLVKHGHKTTFDSGKLIVALADYALPGDTWDLNLDFVTRLLTPIDPIMDNIYFESQVWSGAWRLVWDNSKKFFGEQKNPGDTTDYLIPKVNITALQANVNSLYFYSGLCRLGKAVSPVALIPRMYNLIYNEWYRDQNLQDSLPVPTDDGPDDGALYNIMRRGKRHDYFTSCLPFPQKGPAVELPLGEEASVTGLASITTGTSATLTRDLRQRQTTAVSLTYNNQLFLQGNQMGSASAEHPLVLNGTIDGIADLSSATSVTINSLRQAVQLQRYFERNARGGTRYTEWVHNHFGVVSPDARQQRPEYLGGGHTPINISQVAQTTQENGFVGDLGAFSFTRGHHRFIKSFTEHSVIIWIINVRADITYQQGINRKHFMNTVFDTPIPVFAHLGEQEVLNRELFFQGTAADNDVLGYQERFAEWRYMPSRVSGLFNSDNAQPLDTWHLADDYANLPVLDSQWIQDNPPIKRVVRQQDQHEFKADLYFHGHITRALPTYSVPGLMDHF